MRREPPPIEGGPDHAKTTVYVVQSFEMRKRGRQTGLSPVAPVQARDRAHALLLLERATSKTGIVGAVAFSRTGDSLTGEFGEADILGQAGEVPDELT